MNPIDPQNRELDFLPKLLQPSLRPTLKQFIKSGTISGPVVVEFDPTTACNFSCPECISMGVLNQGQIDRNRIRTLINEFANAGVRAIIFIGGGEPLAHSLMPEPIMSAYELGLAVGLTTNGSLIDRYLAEIAECVKWTRVSVDAGTEQTFGIFRPSFMKNSFKRVISNIERLAKVKKGTLGYSFLLLERVGSNGLLNNYDELFEAGALAKELGCDYFEIKPAVDQEHNLIPFSLTTKRILLEQLHKLQMVADDHFRIIQPSSLQHLFTSELAGQAKSYQSCPTLHLRTVVTPTGIYPCPYKRGNKKNLIGTVDSRFDEFWKSNVRIQKLNEIDPSVACPFYCIRHEMNVFLTDQAKVSSDGADVLTDVAAVEINDDLFI